MRNSGGRDGLSAGSSPVLTARLSASFLSGSARRRAMSRANARVGTTYKTRTLFVFADFTVRPEFSVSLF